MHHIFNISKVKDKMSDPPKAQRMHRFLNCNEFELLTKDQIEDFVRVIKSENQKIIELCESLL